MLEWWSRRLESRRASHHLQAQRRRLGAVTSSRDPANADSWSCSGDLRAVRKPDAPTLVDVRDSRALLG